MPLTEDQITQLFLKYQRERDRYVMMAATVQKHLQVAVLNHHIRAVVTSRAKDVQSFQGKLQKDSEKLEFDRLISEFCPDILDVAGTRILLYEFDKDSSAVIHIIEELFDVATENRHRKDHGINGHRCYQARHRVVSLRSEQLKDPGCENLGGVVCEVQVVSLVKHIWNELEHDIKYKDPESMGQPDEHQKAWLSVLWDSLQAAQTAAANLSNVTDKRRAAKQVESAPIKCAEDLQLALGIIIQRPFSGNTQRLLELLEGTELILSRATLQHTMKISDHHSIERGREVASTAGLEVNDDSEALIAFLWDDRGGDFSDIAGRWSGPSTGLKNFIAGLARKTGVAQ